MTAFFAAAEDVREVSSCNMSSSFREGSAVADGMYSLVIIFVIIYTIPTRQSESNWSSAESIQPLAPTTGFETPNLPHRFYSFHLLTAIVQSE
jgi:hypothetical protein